MTDESSGAIEAIKQRRSQIGDFIIISKRDGILEIDLKRSEDHPFANASEIDFFNNATDDIDTLLAALAASEARVAALHTDHEYDVEKVLWRLLVANQQYILALVEGDTVLAGVRLNRLKVFQQLWLKNGEWYMQHPKWDTANDDIIGDIAG